MATPFVRCKYLCFQPLIALEDHAPWTVALYHSRLYQLFILVDTYTYLLSDIP